MAYRDYCERELAALAEHSTKHLAPDSIGWTKVYKLNPADPFLPRLDFTADRLYPSAPASCTAVRPLISPLSAVNAEFGIRSIGFGPSRHCGIIADLDGDDVCDDLVRTVDARRGPTVVTRRHAGGTQPRPAPCCWSTGGRPGLSTFARGARSKAISHDPEFAQVLPYFLDLIGAKRSIGGQPESQIVVRALMSHDDDQFQGSELGFCL